MRGRIMIGLATALALVGIAVPASGAQALAPPPHIGADAVAAHLDRLQAIADESGGNRAAGTEGYAQSADYVAETLTAVGFTVELQKCESCTEPDSNVIADWPGGDESATIMFGAHLDSVEDGPGSNDNGSGSAALLQVALTLAEAKPGMLKHVRFGWWADEEQGMNGSAYYVENSGVDDLEAYINLDMVGSPNPGYFLSHLDTPYGQAMATYLESAGAPAEEKDGDCDCSDDQPFADAGVPTTYLDTGDEGIMTEDQADKWQGTAGEAFDPCYHEACDSYPDNIDTTALENSANTTAQALWTLAVTTD